MASDQENMSNVAPCGVEHSSLGAGQLARKTSNRSRQQLLAIFLTLLLILLAAGETQAFAQTTQAQLQKVDVTSDANATSVAITGYGALVPNLTILKSHTRVVISLVNTMMETPYNHISVGSSD